MYRPKHKREEPSLEGLWSRISEKNKARYAEFEKEYCVEYPDAMDGFVIHTPACPNYQHMAISGSNCIGFRRASYWPAGLSAVR